MSTNSHKLNIFKLSIVLLGIVFSIFAPAQSLLSDIRNDTTNITAKAGTPDLNCNEDLSDAGKQIFCNDASSIPGNKSTLQTVIDNNVNILVGFIGFILAIVILVSAIQIVSSGGSPDAMKSAKNRLTQAAISLGLLISFRAILALIGI